MPKEQKLAKILFLSANPFDNPRLTVDQEFNEIFDKLRMVEYRDYFTINTRPAVSITDLQQVLMQQLPNIVHFSGHGSDTNALIFQNSEGKAEIVPPKALAEIFQYLDDIRLVILNACYSAPQAQAISKYVDRVTGTTTAIYDEAAREFAVYFYQALGFGKSVEDAFELAKIQLQMFKIPEEQMPILLKREGTETSKVFFTRSPVPEGTADSEVIKPTENKAEDRNALLSNLKRDTEDLLQSYNKLLGGQSTLEEFWEKLRPTLLKLSRSSKLIGGQNAESLNLNLINLATIFGDYRAKRDIGDEHGAESLQKELMMVSRNVLNKMENISSSLDLPPSDAKG